MQSLFGDTFLKSLILNDLTDQTPSNMGVAIANVQSKSNLVMIRLLDSAGTEVRRTTLSMGPLTQVSRFLKELFPDLENDFQGTVEVAGNLPVAVLGLRFTGLTFTTFPVRIVLR